MPNSPLEYLKSLDSKGIRLDLSPVRRTLERLGHPERNYRAVLVAGTNGKGSISAMIASILREAGLTVGLYTSPHLIDFRERIRVNGRMIARKDLTSLIEEVRSPLDEDLTYFEFATVLAFLYFRREKADIAVLEVGMGGRLDATNAAEPELSVISNIAIEHGDYLGRTLESIAGEKAGIIRENGCCITGSRNPKVIRTLEGICRERMASFYRVGKDFRVRRGKDRAFSYRGLERRFGHLTVHLKGPHQIQNAAVALGAVEILSKKGVPIPDQAFSNGLAKTRWEGRLEILQERPCLVVDGAHNPAAMAVLVRALREEFTYRKLIVVFGALRDKDVGTMLKILKPLVNSMVITGIPDNKRARRPEDLMLEAGRFFPADRLNLQQRPEEALQCALDQAGPEDLVCVTGSLFLVGAIKKAFCRQK